MRRTSLVIATLALLSATAAADEIRAEDAAHLDVIHTAEGNIWKGVIVDQVPGKTYRILLVGGSTVVVPAADVSRLTKEPNPWFAAGPRSTSQPVAAAPAAIRTESVRDVGISVFSGFAHFPDFQDGSTHFDLVLRFSYERRWGSVGVRPALRFELVPLPGSSETELLVHSGGEMSLTGRWGAVAPYGGIGFGLTSITGEADAAVHLDTGADLLLNDHFALGAALSYHRELGFATESSGDVSFVSFTLGATAHL
jgi:hypothetical protein